MSQTIFGGDPNEYVTLTMRDSSAEIDKGPIPVQVLGPEGAQSSSTSYPQERSLTSSDQLCGLCPS